MPTSPEKALADFLAPLTSWEKKALRWDYASLTPQEWLEHNRQQDEVAQLRVAYEQILRNLQPQWREYCKAQKNFFNATTRIEAKQTLHPSALGRPNNDALADEAARLQQAGLSHAKIALRLNQGRGLNHEDKGSATRESVRKLLQRRRVSQNRTPDEN